MKSWAKPAQRLWVLGPLACVLCLTAGAAQARHHHAYGHHAIVGRPQIGRASYYGTHEAGRKTASGARFRPSQMTAASKTLPLGTRARVTNTETGQSADVTVTDRGPYVAGRIVDVSPKAADVLGMKDQGVVKVKVTPVALPPQPGAR